MWMKQPITFPFTLLYKSIQPGAGSNFISHHKTMAEATQAAAAWLRTNHIGYDVWIAVPHKEVKLESPPVVTETLDYL